MCRRTCFEGLHNQKCFVSAQPDNIDDFDGNFCFWYDHTLGNLSRVFTIVTQSGVEGSTLGNRKESLCCKGFDTAQPDNSDNFARNYCYWYDHTLGNLSRVFMIVTQSGVEGSSRQSLPLADPALLID